MALGIAAVVIAEVGFIWMLGQTGDHFDAALHGRVLHSSLRPTKGKIAGGKG